MSESKKFFEVFKAGNYPQGKFSIEDVEALAGNYDPLFSEAPVTLDHEQKGPAYAWVSELKAENGILKASFRDVSPELKKYVQAGKYKKISVEIYRELEGKKPYLKSVSFLGAAIPQIKGMASVEFKEGESQIFIFEIEEPQNQELTVLKEQVSELENQIKLISDTKNLNETVTKLQEKIQEMSVQIIKVQDDSTARLKAEEELVKLQAEIKKTDFEKFLEKQLESGCLTPTQKDISLKIFLSLDNTQKFIEAENSVDDFKELLKSLPKQVDFDEFATKNKQIKNTEFTNFEGADEDSYEIYKEAKILSEKEKIPFKDALLKIYK